MYELMCVFCYSVGPMLDKLKRNSVIIDSNGDVRVIFDRQIKTYCDPIVINGTTAITPGDVSCGDEFKCEIQLYSWTYFDTDMKLEVSCKQAIIL